MLEAIYVVLLTAVVGVLVTRCLRHVLDCILGASPTDTVPPGWNTPPCDPKMGDLKLAAAAGGLYIYLSQRHRGGRCPVFSFWWRNQRVVSTCSQVAFKDTETLCNIPSIFTESTAPLHGSKSLICLNGSEWVERRKVLSVAFRGRNLESFFSTFVTIAEETESRWSCSCDSIPLMKEMFTLALKGIICTSFASTCPQNTGFEWLAERYHLCKTEMDHWLLEAPQSVGCDTAFKRNLDSLREALSVLLHARMNGREEKNMPFLDTLIASGAPTEQNIDDMVTFMAGFHTAGFYMMWLFCYLSQHQDVQEKLHREIVERTAGDHGNMLKTYTLSSRSYLRQVLDEALRLSTTAPFDVLYSDEDLVMDGYHIPAKTPIFHAIGVTMNDEAIWDSPNHFNPDRFSPGFKHSKQGPEFRPFGVSHFRRCPANQFTYFMVSVYVAVLLQRYRILSQGENIPEKTFGVAASPDREVHICVQSRQQ